jgi:hypothetical protein
MVLSASNVCKVCINNNHSFNGKVYSLAPIMGTNLSFKLEVILSFPVVLINSSTVGIIDIASIGNRNGEVLHFRVFIGLHWSNLSHSGSLNGRCRPKVAAAGDKAAPLSVTPCEGHQVW